MSTLSDIKVTISSRKNSAAELQKIYDSLEAVSDLEIKLDTLIELLAQRDAEACVGFM
jgi:hypothetical protein